jgi:hypothetical protein
VGRLLRWAQETAGLNGLQLAAKLHWSPTKLSRTLTGFRPPLDIEVATILGLCGVTGKERDRVLRLCYPQEDSGFRLPQDEQWSVFLTHAKDAVHLVDVQPLIVPWMLQTADYTRALFSDDVVVPDEQEVQVAIRRGSLDLLGLPQVDVLVYEWALRTPISDMSVMSEQLHHLLRMSVRPSVSMRVVPLGRGVQAGRHGQFTLLGYADCPSVLYREDHCSGALLDEQEVVDTYRSVAKHLDTIALDEQQSRELIAHIATGLYVEHSEQFVPADGDMPPAR